MIQNFSIEVPLNQTSLGQQGAGILVEMFRRELSPNIFTISQVDLSQLNIPEGFIDWLNLCTNKAPSNFKKDEVNLKLWHISGSHLKVGYKNRLHTVHELDKITDTEVNIMRQYDSVTVPSVYNQQVFAAGGIKSDVVPNFFDQRHIFETKIHKDENITYWSLIGKYEKRKHTKHLIDLWIRKYGGNKEHRLNLSVWNMHLFQNVPTEQRMNHFQSMIQHEIGRPLPWNVNVLGFMNYKDFNQVLNCCDIDLSGLSGAEGFNLPYNATRCLGKRGVCLNAHAHLDYATTENSILVEPTGKQDAKDGVFFGDGQFNQGNIYSLPADEIVITAFEEALARPVPDKALAEKLKEKFSVKNSVDLLLSDF